MLAATEAWVRRSVDQKSREVSLLRVPCGLPREEDVRRLALDLCDALVCWLGPGGSPAALDAFARAEGQLPDFMCAAEAIQEDYPRWLEGIVRPCLERLGGGQQERRKTNTLAFAVKPRPVLLLPTNAPLLACPCFYAVAWLPEVRFRQRLLGDLAQPWETGAARPPEVAWCVPPALARWP